MSEYNRGFDAGFAAAVWQGLPPSTKTLALGFEAGPCKRIVVTLPDDVFDAVKARAMEAGRSMSAEIRTALEQRS